MFTDIEVGRMRAALKVIEKIEALEKGLKSNKISLAGFTAKATQAAANIIKNETEIKALNIQAEGIKLSLAKDLGVVLKTKSTKKDGLDDVNTQPIVEHYESQRF